MRPLSPRSRRSARPLALLVATSVVIAAPLHAQTAGAGIIRQSFTFSESGAVGIGTLALTTIPFSARVPLGDGADLGISGAYAEGSLESNLGTATISGLTDSQLTLGVRAGWARVTGVALLPTGKDTQSLEESRVAGAIAADLLPFGVSNWGSGAGGGLSVSAAVPVGPIGVGLSVTYLARKSFEPLDDQEFSYRPGDLLRVRVALDRTAGEAGKATLQLLYERNGEDRIDDANLFRSGDRFQIVGSYAFPVGPAASGITYASVLHRNRSTFLGTSETAATQDLVRMGGGVRIPLGGGVIQPDAEARLFRRGDGIDQGWDLAAGASYEVPGAGWTLVPTARIHVGSLEVRQGVSTTFTGFEVGLAARFGRGRS